MAYATSNPPVLLIGSIGNVVPNIWAYKSADVSATVDTTGYITNGGDLGMKVNDLVIVLDTTTPLVKSHLVITVSATAPGAVDLGDGTTIGLNTNTD